VFGSFFDSVIDRYSDVVLFFGLLVYYGRINRFRYVVLVAFVMVTSLMVSYTRARAEALIGQCKVGFMERPERIVLIILGALFNHWGVMAPALWCWPPSPPSPWLTALSTPTRTPSTLRQSAEAAATTARKAYLRGFTGCGKRPDSWLNPRGSLAGAKAQLLFCCIYGTAEAVP